MGKVGSPSSLAGQLTAVFVGTILLVMLVLAVIVPRLDRAQQLAALEQRLGDEAQLVADYAASVWGAGPPNTLEAIAKRLGERTDTRITIIALDGTVVGESHQGLARVGNLADRVEVRQALAQGRGVDLHRSETVGYPMLYVAVPIVRDGSVLGTARTARSLNDVDRLVGQLTSALLLAAAASGLLALGVAWLAARAITRPLARLTAQAAALAANPADPGRLARGGGPAEVVQLGDTLEGMAGAVQDSLRRVAAERDRLDGVLANLADGIVIVASDGRVERLNAAAAQLLGMPAAQAAGRTTAEVLRDHELVRLVDRVRTGDALPRVETAFVERPQPRRLLRAAVSRVGVGADRQTLLVLQDLTELRRLETIRRDFVANVSHELRTPIAAIKAMTETLRDGALDEPEAAWDFLARIEQEVDGLHQLVEELLELSRLESGRVTLELAPVEPAALVHDAVRRLAPLAERAWVSLAAEMPPDLPAVRADRERMRRVLVSVLHNAIKFTPPGGAITVRATAEPEWVQLAIADTGVGIAPELLPRVFERFYKADQARAGGGTGLGLAIAKHTVQLHDGEIWAESDGPGRGTTVHVSLPRSERD